MRPPAGLPFITMTLTPVTVTLNAFSTAFLICGLLARMSTSKMYLLAPDSAVLFSVTRGRMMISYGFSVLSTSRPPGSCRGRFACSRGLWDRRAALLSPLAAPQRLGAPYRFHCHHEAV